MWFIVITYLVLGQTEFLHSQFAFKSEQECVAAIPDPETTLAIAKAYGDPAADTAGAVCRQRGGGTPI
jgi:hypothetical protein